jgi:hypothetical protein
MLLAVELHPHARERAQERGVTISEIVDTVNAGERRSAKHGRTAFRRNFAFGGLWRGRRYATKQVEAIAVEDGGRWLVITVIAKYY